MAALLSVVEVEKVRGRVEHAEAVSGVRVKVDVWVTDAAWRVKRERVGNMLRTIERIFVCLAVCASVARSDGNYGVATRY